jgi:glycosyltransferase involved in cell wall biosynthesis
MKVAIVMPPITSGSPDLVIEGWSTVIRQAEALSTFQGCEVVVACRTSGNAALASHRGIPFHFFNTDRDLATNVRGWAPDVVHVHGLTFSRLTARLGRALPSGATLVLQHHGERPGGLRVRLAHRVARRYVDGYLFTGVSGGQAQPFIDAGMIRKDAGLYEVLEAASTLPDSPIGPVSLVGAPSILWVGRLIASKDPLTAVNAFAQVDGRFDDAHLHLLATDRTLEQPVRRAIERLGAVGQRIHLHDPVPITEIGGWYTGADIYLSTSQREGSGYALIEAMSAGCVPVVSAIASHLSIVGPVGQTFSAGDIDAAASSLSLAADNYAARRGFVQNYANNALSWEAVAEQTVVAYRHAARSRRVSE